MTHRTNIPIPERMRRLPRNRAGYVVPWFVGWVDGEPDFRVIRPGGIVEAYRGELCWLCGQRRGAFATFVIGPMCAVNRVSAEPPSHKECAEYAAHACPFLTTPKMVRREKGLEDLEHNVAGMMIRRNPGVTLCWTTRAFKPFRADGGVLFDVGDPTETTWWAQGRPATRAEVVASIDSGLPILREVAEEEGDEAIAELEQMVDQAMVHLPPAEVSA